LGVYDRFGILRAIPFIIDFNPDLRG